MKLIIKKATTSKIIQVFIQDASKSDGSGLTGLVYNTASLTTYYIKVGDASATVITLATATVGTWTSSGFIEVDATNMPGVYELGIPDACLTTVEQVVIMLKGAANMAPVVIEIQLRDNTEKDIYDRIGAPAGANISADLLVIDNFVDELESRLTAVRAGYIDNLSAGAVALASVCTEVRLAELDAANLITDVANVKAETALIVADTNELQLNQGNWATATGFATPTNITAGIITTVTNLTNAPTVGDFNATMKTSLNAATPASVQNISAQTGDSFARLGVAGAGLTALGDTRIANLDATVSSRLTPAGTLAVCTTNTDMRGTDLAALATALATAQADLNNPAQYKADISSLALEATLTTMKGATFAGDTDSLEAIRDRGDAAWITATGFSVPNEYDIQMGYIPSNLADVPTAAELIAAHGSGSWEGTTPADVADAVWDEVMSGHTTSGTFGSHIKNKLLTVAKFIGLK